MHFLGESLVWLFFFFVHLSLGGQMENFPMQGGGGGVSHFPRSPQPYVPLTLLSCDDELQAEDSLDLLLEPRSGDITDLGVGDIAPRSLGSTSIQRKFLMYGR